MDGRPLPTAIASRISDRDRDEDAPAGGRDRRPGGGECHQAERQPDTEGLGGVSVRGEQPDAASDEDPDKHEQQPRYTGQPQGHPHPPVADRSRQIWRSWRSSGLLRSIRHIHPVERWRCVC